MFVDYVYFDHIEENSFYSVKCTPGRTVAELNKERESERETRRFLHPNSESNIFRFSLVSSPRRFRNLYDRLYLCQQTQKYLAEPFSLMRARIFFVLSSPVAIECFQISYSNSFMKSSQISLFSIDRSV